MTRNILDQYSSLLREKRDIEKRIERLERKLEMIRSGDNMLDAVRGGAGGIQTYHIEGYPTAADDEITYLLTKNRRLLRERERQIEETIVSIEKFINSVSDSRMRRMISYRYIDNMEWQEVAQRMGRHYTEYSCKKQMERFLKEISSK